MADTVTQEPIRMAGSEADQVAGRSLLGLFQAHGRFMAADRVIRLTASSLSAGLSREDESMTPQRVLEIARLNPDVFAIEENGDEPVIATTRFGKSPIPASQRREHDFAQRLMTPVPRLAGQLRGEIIRLDTGWNAPLTEGDSPNLFDLDQPLPAAIIVDRPMLGPARRPGEEEPEPELPADLLPPVDVEFGTAASEVFYPWERPAAAEPAGAAAEPAATQDEVTQPVEEAPEQPATPAFDDLAAQIIDEEPVAFADPEPVVEPIVAEEPVVEPEPEPVAIPEPAPEPRRMPAIKVSDVSGVEDDALAAAITQRLAADVRVATFNDQWMTEDRVPRLSRGDLRRIKEYIQEQEQPLTDDVLVQDVLGVRPNSPDFDLMRFAINYRLSREHRDYDFVGTGQQRFWSTSTLPQIGTTRRKPNELGTDYRFLLEELPEQPEYRSTDSVLHVVSFFEYYHGLLPYDAEIQALLPAPVLPDQRTAMLTFETPQSYTTFLVELRYPTPNRGGFILGLDDFFGENLVPGALIQIQRTDNDGHYHVEFLPAANQSARLLELDERRSQRYAFHEVQYGCEVEDTMLLTEDRFAGLNGQRPVEDKVRRRPESLVAAVFERIGQKIGPGYSAPFADLFAAVNVERPFSETLLRRVLETDETGAFAKDPDHDDAYSFVPSTT
ncbi:MAG TPA: hypothetical protein VGT61_05490 [Thermomicrobiales bacterium]|jgi:hypothetical protein|nr:hypothetical protein [Thermomicrobiales bacterium]